MNKKSLFSVAVLATTLLFSGWQICNHVLIDRKEQAKFEELILFIEDAKTDEKDENSLNPIHMLYEKNPDVMGWLSIEGTNIDYPVMHAPDRPNFYLNHDFYGNDSIYGVPYLSEASNLGSDNMVLYGHHIKGGKMFGTLVHYKEKNFYEKHPIIHFNTHRESRRYEIIATFNINPDEFPYHDFIDGNEEEFDAFVSKIKSLSIYDTGKTAAHGDKLLTLSTCEYSGENSRMVVVGKLFSKDLL